VLAILKDEPLLVFDCETTGMDFRKKSILMLQFGVPSGDQIVIDARDYPVELFKCILEDKSKTFIGHNIKFDYNMLKPYRVLLTNVYDTMVVDKVIHNGKFDTRVKGTYSLDGVYKRYFDKEIIKSTRDEFHTITDKPFTHAQIMYGANDVLYPFEIKVEQEKLIQEYGLAPCVKLENKLVLVLGDIEYNGFHINTDKWKDIIVDYSNRLKETTKKLDELLLQTAPQYKVDAFQQDLFDSSYMNTRICKINWSSDKQVYDILDNVYDIRPVDKHKKPSSGAAAIQALKKPHEITDLLLQYREEEKVTTSFGTDYLEKHVDEDGRIRTTYNQIIETGRISSRNPNLQQIPGTATFREAFEAPEGKVISTADYSNQEARIMADQSGDKTYIDFFKEGGGDVHSFVATTMFSASFGREFIVTQNNENKDYRQKGKVLNFFVSFGGSAYTLSRTLRIPEREAQELIDAFYKGFPNLKKLFNDYKVFGLMRGYIRTNSVTNRIRWFPSWSEYNKLKQIPYGQRSPQERSRTAIVRGFIERRAMNTPIQGTAGDMTKTALIILRDKLLQNGVTPFTDAPVKIVSMVHDECSLEIDEQLADKYASLQQESMEEAGGIFVKSIPMPTTPVIAKHWTH
jgi:DNA polymerase-1